MPYYIGVDKTTRQVVEVTNRPMASPSYDVYLSDNVTGVPAAKEELLGRTIDANGDLQP